MVLVQIFPENAFYDLQWSLLKLVESVWVDDENKYIQLINSCPSQEWRDTLNAVSYTHLDVYKRQEIYTPKTKIKLSPVIRNGREFVEVTYGNDNDIRLSLSKEENARSLPICI